MTLESVSLSRSQILPSRRRIGSVTSTRSAGSRWRRESTSLLLFCALLAVAWLTSPAEGSLPRAGFHDANPAALAGAAAVDSGRFLTAGLETPFSLITVEELEEVLTRNPASEASGLNLVEGLLLEPPELTSRACEARLSLHLEPVDFGLNPQRGPPLEIPDLHQGEFVAEPKTRIGGFRLELEDLTRSECPLSLGLRRGYGAEGWGLAEEERPDPLGLQGAPTPCPVPPPGHRCYEGSVDVGTTFAPTFDRKRYVMNLWKAGIYGLDAQNVAAERFPVPWIEKYKAYSISSGMRFWGPAIEFVALLEVAAFSLPFPEGGVAIRLGLPSRYEELGYVMHGTSTRFAPGIDATGLRLGASTGEDVSRSAAFLTRDLNGAMEAGVRKASDPDIGGEIAIGYTRSLTSSLGGNFGKALDITTESGRSAWEAFLRSAPKGSRESWGELLTRVDQQRYWRGANILDAFIDANPGFDTYVLPLLPGAVRSGGYQIVIVDPKVAAALKFSWTTHPLGPVH